MRNNLIPMLLLFVLLLGINTGTLAAENTLSAEEKAAGWKLLFNGSTLDGWHVYGKSGAPIKNWRVESGLLKVDKTNGRPGAGDLVSNVKFRDFEFRFEWRMSPGGNSGVNYLFDEQRAPVAAKMYEGDKGNAPIGIEYQLLDDAHYAKNGLLRMSASIYTLFPSKKNALKPIGEFNESRIVVQGQHIEHWLNGRKMAECEIDSQEFKAAVEKTKFKSVPNFAKKLATPIALQDHGEEVAFRNLKIRELLPR